MMNSIVILQMFSGLLSFCGSTIIIYHVLYDRKKNLKRTYFRLLLVMSAFDLLLSSTSIAATFPIPKNSSIPMAFGNDKTCEAQGFITVLGLAVPLYNTSLSIYYFLSIQLKKNQYFIKKTELWMHIFSISYAMLGSLTGLFLNAYNPTPIRCWIAASPYGCLESDEECLHGKTEPILRWLFGGVPIILCFITITTCLSMIFRSLRDQERVMETKYRHSFTSKPVVQESPDITKSKKIQRRNSIRGGTLAQRKKKSALLARQSILYVGGFFLTYIFPFILCIIEHRDEQVVLNLQILTSLFFPLQGFFSFLVFIHPRYLQVRNQENGLSPIVAFWMTLSTPQKSTRNSLTGDRSRFGSRFSRSNVGGSILGGSRVASRAGSRVHSRQSGASSLANESNDSLTSLSMRPWYRRLLPSWREREDSLSRIEKRLAKIESRLVRVDCGSKRFSISKVKKHRISDHDVACFNDERKKNGECKSSMHFDSIDGGKASSCEQLKQKCEEALLQSDLMSINSEHDSISFNYETENNEEPTNSSLFVSSEGDHLQVMENTPPLNDTMKTVSDHESIITPFNDETENNSEKPKSSSSIASAGEDQIHVMKNGSCEKLEQRSEDDRNDDSQQSDTLNIVSYQENIIISSFNGETENSEKQKSSSPIASVGEDKLQVMKNSSCEKLEQKSEDDRNDESQQSDTMNTISHH